MGEGSVLPPLDVKWKRGWGCVEHWALFLPFPAGPPVLLAMPPFIFQIDFLP